MNVTSSPLPTTEPISSEGVVAAGVYVDGRRVANIAIDEASSWRSQSGHVVWIGLHVPDMSTLSSVQRQSFMPAAVIARSRGNCASCWRGTARVAGVETAPKHYARRNTVAS